MCLKLVACHPQCYCIRLSIWFSKWLLVRRLHQYRKNYIVASGKSGLFIERYFNRRKQTSSNQLHLEKNIWIGYMWHIKRKIRETHWIKIWPLNNHTPARQFPSWSKRLGFHMATERLTQPPLLTRVTLNLFICHLANNRSWQQNSIGYNKWTCHWLNGVGESVPWLSRWLNQNRWHAV